MPEKCSAIARSGSRCNRPALTGEPFCLMHSPNAVEVRREASRRGGHARSHQARARAALPAAMDAEETAVWLSVAFKQVLAGELEPKVGTALATIAKALLEARADGELEQRLAALEAELRSGRRSA